LTAQQPEGSTHARRLLLGDVVADRE